MSAVPVFCEEYATIVADPPWRTMAGPLNGREGFGDATGASRSLPYPTMTVDAIKALQVPAANDAHLYLWTTNGYLRDAFDVARAWGFEYSTTLVWAKALMGGGLGGAYGISTEFCLYCRRGKLPALNKVGGTWFNWKRPYDERGKPRHSAKPPEFYALVEHVSPGPYLEMFARQKRSRWHAWGNEVENDVAIADRATPIAPPSERP
jgi:N6-adenosine-specific RNA methylase IME4